MTISVDGKKPNLANIQARLVAKSVVDEDGRLIFKDSDVYKLGLKNAAPLDRVFVVARRLSYISQWRRGWWPQR